MMAETHFDLIIIGAGPGGYTAADRAGAAGLRVLLIEKAHLGGLCLNAGCIPSKALLASAKLYASLGSATKFGIGVENVTFDLTAAHARKARIISGLREGIAYQMNRRGVTTILGIAEILDRRTVRIGDADYIADRLLIATGSRHVKPSIVGIDQAHVWNLSEALELPTLPRNLTVLGVDPIALGVGSIFSQLGVNVFFASEDDTILPETEPDMESTLRLEMRTARFYLGYSIERIAAGTITLRQGTETKTLDADAVIYAAGRAPNMDGFGLERIGLDIYNGAIRVDDQMRTNLPGVYAIGDVTGRSMWAHAASRMADVAVNTMIGTPDRFRLEHVPGVVYTVPEIAWIGLTEAEARKRGYEVRAARLPMNANGRFLTETTDKRGLCKVITDASSGQLLGAHLIAPTASELIAPLIALVAGEFRVRDLKELPLIHPTMTEIFKDTLYEL